MTYHHNPPSTVNQTEAEQESIPMTYDHRSTSIHRATLDHEIETIRIERLMAAAGRHHEGIVERTRRSAGHLLIAMGTALAGREAGPLRTHRA
jgi:hypothetical protein